MLSAFVQTERYKTNLEKMFQRLAPPNIPQSWRDEVDFVFCTRPKDRQQRIIQEYLGEKEVWNGLTKTEFSDLLNEFLTEKSENHIQTRIFWQQARSRAHTPLRKVGIQIEDVD